MAQELLSDVDLGFHDGGKSNGGGFGSGLSPQFYCVVIIFLALGVLWALGAWFK